MPRDLASELIALMARFRACDAYLEFDQLCIEFNRLYFEDWIESEPPDAIADFFSEVHDQLSLTGAHGDLTLDEFKAWLEGALAGYPRLTEPWRRFDPLT